MSHKMFANTELPCEVSGRYVLSQKYTSTLMRHIEEYVVQHGGIEFATLKKFHVTFSLLIIDYLYEQIANTEKAVQSISLVSLRLETCFVCDGICILRNNRFYKLADVVKAIDAVVAPLMHKMDPVPVLWKGFPVFACISPILPVMLQDDDVDLLFRRYDHTLVVKTTTQFEEVVAVSAQFLEFLTVAVAKSEISDVSHVVALILREQEVELDDTNECMLPLLVLCFVTSSFCSCIDESDSRGCPKTAGNMAK